MEEITLYYRQGSSDKVYRASIQAAKDGFTVAFAYGRRGATLQTGTKTQAPVPYEKAKKIFDQLVSEKEGKGYTPGADGTPYQQTTNESRVTGILPQLLYAIDEVAVRQLFADPQWWMQEKYDGCRMLLQKRASSVIGINRRGLQVALPETMAEDAQSNVTDFVLDGEAVGDRLFVFDLLQIGDVDLRPKPYLERHLRLLGLLSNWERQCIHLVPTACLDQEKSQMFEELKSKEAEGVVFKRIDQQYAAGRPATGGPALKFKFHETASFVVSGINGKRSVTLTVFQNGQPQVAGNVTIPPNQPVPAVGQIVECRYLYAFRESGFIYQPVYLGAREDVPPEECTVKQLKFKATSAEVPA